MPYFLQPEVTWKILGTTWPNPDLPFKSLGEGRRGKKSNACFFFSLFVAHPLFKVLGLTVWLSLSSLVGPCRREVENTDLLNGNVFNNFACDPGGLGFILYMKSVPEVLCNRCG